VASFKDTWFQEETNHRFWQELYGRSPHHRAINRKPDWNSVTFSKSPSESQTHSWDSTANQAWKAARISVITSAIDDCDEIIGEIGRSPTSSTGQKAVIRLSERSKKVKCSHRSLLSCPCQALAPMPVVGAQATSFDFVEHCHRELKGKCEHLC
jgi:hypothetical protein